LAWKKGQAVQIVATELYEIELKKILEVFAKENFDATKKFKTYLDTLIINIPTKVEKYKKSIYFDNEKIKDLEYENFTIPFYIDTAKNRYVILGILRKSETLNSK